MVVTAATEVRMMDEQAVREHAQAHVDALLAGDVERATEPFSESLRHDLGSIMAQLPLPLTDGTVESVERGGSGYVAVLHLVGETDSRFRTRWKDRDGRPTLVEFSHVAEAPADTSRDTEDAEAESRA
jgi:hypothetical protein